MGRLALGLVGYVFITKMLFVALTSPSGRTYHHLRWFHFHPLHPAQGRRWQATDQRRPLELLQQTRIPDHPRSRPARRSAQSTGPYQNHRKRHLGYSPAGKRDPALFHLAHIHVRVPRLEPLYAQHDQVIRFRQCERECASIGAGVLQHGVDVDIGLYCVRLALQATSVRQVLTDQGSTGSSWSIRAVMHYLECHFVRVSTGKSMGFFSMA